MFETNQRWMCIRFRWDTWDSRSPLLDLLVAKQHGKFPKIVGSSWKIPGPSYPVMDSWEKHSCFGRI